MMTICGHPTRLSSVGNFNNVGGTSGGLGTFLAGSALAIVSAWFFVDAVRVTSFGNGWVSGYAGGSGGVVFLPLLVGVIGLFYNAKKIWPWLVSGLGVMIIAVEVLSSLRFFFNLKLSTLLIMLVSFAAGIGLILRSLKSIDKSDPKPPWQDAFDGLSKE